MQFNLSYIACHLLACTPTVNSSGVARIWCEEGHETKRKYFKGNTQKYYEIHAINMTKQQ